MKTSCADFHPKKTVLNVTIQRRLILTSANPIFTHTVLINFYGNNFINPLNAELNPICHFLALLGAHHILHISRIRVKHECRISKLSCNWIFCVQDGFFLTFVFCHKYVI